MKFRNSRFAHLVQISNDRFCIFQSLAQQQIYGDSRLKLVYDFFKEERDEKEFLEIFNGVYGGHENRRLFGELNRCQLLTDLRVEDIFDHILREEETRGKGYRLLRILLTDVCNLACSYCKVMPNIIEVTKNPTSNENLERAVRIFFSGSSPDYPKIVHISGGEPLIHWDSVRYIAELVEQFRRPGEKHFIVIGTNGTLINGKRAEFIASHNIKVIVSIDGSKETHDTLRRTHGDGGSFEKVHRGVLLLKELNVSLGISMVIGKHNVDRLIEEIGYVIESYRPISLGVNFMKPPTKAQKDFPFLVSPEQYVRAIYAAYKVYRETGVFFELVYRKISPFVNQRFRYHDCGAAAGTTINIDAKGNIGPCKSFLVLGSVAEDIKKQWTLGSGKELPVLKSLQKRSPVYIDACQECEAIATCGNACAYEAWVESGDMMNIDMKACGYTQLFHREFLADLGEVIESQIKNKSFYVPTSLDRKRLYGNIVIDACNLNSSIGHETEV